MTSANFLRTMFPLRRPRQITRVNESIAAFAGTFFNHRPPGWGQDTILLEHWMVIDGGGLCSMREACLSGGGPWRLFGLTNGRNHPDGWRSCITAILVGEQDGVFVTESGSKYRLGRVSSMARYNTEKSTANLINALRK